MLLYNYEYDTFDDAFWLDDPIFYSVDPIKYIGSTEQNTS
jgi:hypothetical protein